MSPPLGSGNAPPGCRLRQRHPWSQRFIGSSALGWLSFRWLSSSRLWSLFRVSREASAISSLPIRSTNRRRIRSWIGIVLREKWLSLSRHRRHVLDCRRKITAVLLSLFLSSGSCEAGSRVLGGLPETRKIYEEHNSASSDCPFRMGSTGFAREGVTASRGVERWV